MDSEIVAADYKRERGRVVFFFTDGGSVIVPREAIRFSKKTGRLKLCHGQSSGQDGGHPQIEKATVQGPFKDLQKIASELGLIVVLDED